jgi:hypothetical protein
VVFHSSASDLVSGDTNLDYDVFVRDRQNGATERVSVDSLGAEGDAPASTPRSPPTAATWRSTASPRTSSAGTRTGTCDVFVRDRQSGTTERVSVDSLGAAGERPQQLALRSPPTAATWPSSSVATNLASGDTNGTSDVFVRDRQSGTTERVSVDSLGVQGNDAARPLRSPPTAATWRSRASPANLVRGDTNGLPDVFVRDRQIGTTERVSVDSRGRRETHSSARLDLRRRPLRGVRQLASNLVAGDTNGTSTSSCATASSARPSA